MTTSKTAPKATPAAAEPTPDAPAEHPTLWHALAAFQRNLPSIRKGQTATVNRKDGGPGYSYDYADLTDVSEVVLPLLAAQGLAWITSLDTREDGTLVLNWELVHGASADSRVGTIPVGRAGQDWQGIGSAITYARRYALTAATGVAPGGDDNDGKDARAGGAPQREAAPAQPEYLPAGLYDLGGLTDVEATRVMFRRARAAGHLPLLVLQGDGGDAVPFGKFLTDLGTTLGQEAPDAPAPAEQSQDDADAAEAAAVAAHEAELAAAAERDAAGGVESPEDRA
jgi:hypothetical protein